MALKKMFKEFHKEWKKQTSNLLKISPRNLLVHDNMINLYQPVLSIKLCMTAILLI